MTEAKNNSPWLTQESYDKLKAELESLYENRPVSYTHLTLPTTPYV